MSFARALYTALVIAVLPRALLHVVLRSRREPAYRAHVRERFGFYDIARPRAPLIWIHAVSVGETRAAQPLVQALRERYPDHHILLTHMTPTGRRTGEAVFGDRVERCYLPYDYPRAVARFVEYFRPRVGIVLETEVWPNLLAACRARGVPTFLVNARLSEKSYRGYARVLRLAREALRTFSGIAAQTTDDARRLEALGATHVIVAGNIKFDANPPAEQIDRGRAWRREYAERPVLLAASTRDGEEALLLDALDELNVRDALIIIVPRHPQRFDQVATLLERRGMRYQRRSANTPVMNDVQVLLGDSMGELTAYYAACDVAFIGGSLLDYGSQNFIEACAVGKPVLIGASTFNFAEAAERAIELGAALPVKDAHEVMREAGRLLNDRGARERMSTRALEFAQAHRGATQRIVDTIAPALR